MRDLEGVEGFVAAPLAADEPGIYFGDELVDQAGAAVGRVGLAVPRRNGEFRLFRRRLLWLLGLSGLIWLFGFRLGALFARDLELLCAVRTARWMSS